MKHCFNLLYQPEETWKKIKDQGASVSSIYVKFLLVFAAIPVISAYIGSVYVGWSVGADTTTKLTAYSAGLISIAAYIGIIIGVLVFARFIHWMAKTYQSPARFKACFTLVAYACTPLFLVSLISLYPILWLDTLLTLVALAYSVKLLFSGVPTMMEVNQEKGFLFANSILAVAMVMSVGTIVITVLFWGAGIAPEFTQ